MLHDADRILFPDHVSDLVACDRTFHQPSGSLVTNCHGLDASPHASPPWEPTVLPFRTRRSFCRSAPRGLARASDESGEASTSLGQIGNGERPPYQLLTDDSYVFPTTPPRARERRGTQGRGGTLFSSEHGSPAPGNAQLWSRDSVIALFRLGFATVRPCPHWDFLLPICSTFDPATLPSRGRGVGWEAPAQILAGWSRRRRSVRGKW